MVEGNNRIEIGIGINTTELTAKIRGLFAELEQLYRSAGAGATGPQFNTQLTQLLSQVKGVKGALSQAVGSGVFPISEANQFRGQLDDLIAKSNRLKAGVSFNRNFNTGIPAFAGPGQSAEEQRAAARAAAAGGVVLSPAREQARTQAEAAQEQAQIQEILAANQGYIQSVVRLRTAQQRASAQIEEGLSEQSAYIQSLARTRIAQAAINAEVNQRLAAEHSYAESLATSKAAQTRISLETSQSLLGNREYIESLAAAKSVRARETLEVQRMLAADSDYIQATAAAANLRRSIASQTEAARLSGAGFESQTPAGLILPPAASPEETAQRKAAGIEALALQEGSNKALAAERDAGLNLAAAKARQARVAELGAKGTDTELELNAQRQVIENQLNRALKQQVAAAERAAYQQAIRSGAGPEVVGTGFQRLQAGIAGRSGSFRNPTDFLTAQQFLSSRFLTTAGFAVSGVATYAAFAGISKMVQETTKLQTILATVQQQFVSLGEARNFEQFRNGIVGIARDTGVAADQVATLAFQFKGAFSNLSNAEVLQQAEAAVELSRVTGLTLAEITDNLTAAAINYNATISTLGDKALAVQERTGVLAKETLDFVSQISPVAKQIGLSLDQVNAIAGVAQQTSGKSGRAIAEGFSRTLPEIQKNALKIIGIFEQAAPKSVNRVSQQLASGQTGAVLLEIQKIYGTLSKAGQNQLLNVLGEPRNIQYLIGFLNNYDKTVKTVQASQNSAGKSAEYFARLQGTLSQTFARLGQTLRTIGTDLLRLGLGDLFTSLATGLALLLTAGAGVIRFFADLNQSMHGIPATILLIVLALNGLVKVLATLQELKIGQILTSVVSGLGGSLGKTALGGFLGSKIGSIVSSFRGARAVSQAATVAGETSTASGLILPAGVSAAPLAGGVSTATVATAGAALVAVAGLVAYMKVRSRFQKEAADRKQQLLKDDEKTLTALAQASRDSSGHLTAGTVDAPTEIGHFLTGRKSDSEIALDALQEKISNKTLLPQLKDLQAVLDKQKINSGKVDKLIQDLTKNPDDDKNFNEAQDTLNDLQRFKNVSPAQVALFRNLNQKQQDIGGGVKLLPNFSKNIKAAFDKSLGAIDQIKDLQGQIDEANKSGRKDLVDGLQKKIDRIKVASFGTTNVDVGQLEPGLRALKEEFLRTGTLPNIEDAPRIKELANKVGLDVGTVVKGITDIGKANDDAAKTIKNELSFQNLQLQLQAGTILPSSFIAATKVKLRRAQKLLADVMANVASTDDQIAQAQQAVNEIQTALKSAQDALVKSRVENAVRASEAAGKGANVVEPLRQHAIEAALPDAQTFDARLDLANQYVASQKAFVEFAAQNAGSAERAAAILKQGTKIPAFIREVFIESELRSLGSTATNLFEAIAELTGKNIDDVIKLAAEVILAGGSAVGALAKILESKVQEALGAAAAGVFGGGAAGNNDAAREQYNKAKDLQKRLNGVAAALGGVSTGADSASGNQPSQAELDRTAENITEAKIGYYKSLAGGDTEKQARYARDLANAQLAYARAHGDTTAEYQALGAQADAERQIAEAQSSKAQALIALYQAQAGNDPIRTAQLAIAAADEQARLAAQTNDIVGQINAATARVNAQRQLQQGMFDIANATTELFIAQANAAGDTVKAAQLAQKESQDKLNQHLAQGFDPNGAQIKQDQADLATKTAAVRDSILNKRLEDINFDLDMGKISNGQAIVRLQNLAHTAGLTESEQHDIARQIKSLKDRLGKDLQFNLPDIILPTFYEARRLSQQGAGGFASSFVGRGTNYSDNRQIVVNVNGAGANPNAIASAVVKQLNQPPTFGARGRLY